MFLEISPFNTYTFFVCSEIGAATRNVDGTFTYERKIQPDEIEYEVRNGQVNQRVKECEMAYNLLCQLSCDNSIAQTTAPDNTFQLHEAPPTEFLDSLKQARINLTDKCYVSGHSFGGATALKCFHTSK